MNKRKPAFIFICILIIFTTITSIYWSLINNSPLAIVYIALISVPFAISRLVLFRKMAHHSDDSYSQLVRSIRFGLIVGIIALSGFIIYAMILFNQIT